MSVLIVEDDAAHAELETRSLLDTPEAQFKVEHVSTSSEVLMRAAQVVEGAYDALIVDYELGATDGVSLLAQLRALGATTPALLLTSFSSEDLAVRALRVQANEYLPKEDTLSGNALGRAVLSMVERQRHAEALTKARLRAARLEGALLAARTAAHVVNNQLTLALGFSELLSQHPDLPEQLKPLAERAYQGAQQAAASIQQLLRLARLEEQEHGAMGPTIDLSRSTD